MSHVERCSRLFVGAALICLARIVPSMAAERPAIDFNAEIRPILAKHCYKCHGPDEEARKGKLRLDLRAKALAPAASGSAAIVPGKSGESELVARIESNDENEMMPPPKAKLPLSAADKAKLKYWIEAGAEYQEHWSLVPPKYPTPPEVKKPDWVRGPIDRFVLAKLEAAGLAPAPEADRATLIRRVSLDLTGLPPTIAEVTAFENDKSPDAYAKVVDRLLKSNRFGEHWARVWLDLARYADTKGYEKDQPRTIWRFRDWVIDAFNSDLPYDQFTIRQLAGDLLPGASDDILLATAFHRNTMTNDEGGTDDEEFRVTAVKDRVDTTGQVWMGLTIGCAKCHSHKYDPISQSDYYRFYAAFNQTEDADRGDDFPTALIPTADQKARIDAKQAVAAKLKADLDKAAAGLGEKRKAWEAKIAGSTPWTRLAIEKATSTGGATLKVRPDASILASGARPDTDKYLLTIKHEGAPINVLRLDVMNDKSLAGGGPGRDKADPNAVVSEFRVFATKPGGKPEPIALKSARADFAQGGYDAARAIDGKGDTGWAWSPQIGKPHAILFELASPFDPKSGMLTIEIEQNYPKLSLGCFTVSASGDAPAKLSAEVDTIGGIASVPKEKRTAEQNGKLDEAFLAQEPATSSLLASSNAADAELKVLRDKVAKTPVLKELPAARRRVTRIHRRGNFLDPGETVTAALPEAFGSKPGSGPIDRLAVARWIVSKENPLTPRVAVNRAWARLFGLGIVETEEDFGSQGIPPSHPELLDWLAVEFRDNLHWSWKGLLRTIVLSNTYRQSSHQDPAKIKADPRNVLLSRGARFRLPAEAVRDQALAASGLLSAKIGGPSVMPPQPPGIWKAAYSSLKWETSPGEDRYRRGIYTFWRRTSPYPAMTTFDAGSGEVCTLRRVRTNTPLQALVTLNDPAYVEAAGALGRRMTAEGGEDARSRLAHGFRLVLARNPQPAEVDRLLQLRDKVLARYQADPKAAESLIGASNVKLDAVKDKAETASWTLVGNVLLNLDETLTRP